MNKVIAKLFTAVASNKKLTEILNDLFYSLMTYCSDYLMIKC